jgi:hypothetical protein
MDKKQILCVKLVEYFIQNISSNEDFCYNLLENEKKILEKFIKKNNKKGFDFLSKYIEFQFNFWRGCEINFLKIRMSWIFGDKAVKRFEEKKQISPYFSHIRKQIPLNITSILNPPNQNYDYCEIKPWEEKEKERFFNKKEGLIWCLDVTTLYNPKSIFCEDCNNKFTCKNLLETNLPKVYKKREIC